MRPQPNEQPVWKAALAIFKTISPRRKALQIGLRQDRRCWFGQPAKWKRNKWKLKYHLMGEMGSAWMGASNHHNVVFTGQTRYFSSFGKMCLHGSYQTLELFNVFCHGLTTKWTDQQGTMRKSSYRRRSMVSGPCRQVGRQAGKRAGGRAGGHVGGQTGRQAGRQAVLYSLMNGESHLAQWNLRSCSADKTVSSMESI